MATLSEFLKSGKLGDIHHGMRRDEVVAILGQPNDTSVARNPLLLKFGGLQLTFFKPAGAEHRELSQIGLHYGPSWEPIPAAVLPSDFVGNPETTIAGVRAFLAADGIDIHSGVDAEFGSHLILASGARITFDDGMLHRISFPRKTTNAKKQVSVSVPTETWNKAKSLANETGQTVPGLFADWIAEKATEL